MIFATLGNEHRRFARFEKAVEIIANTFPDEEVIFQFGHSQGLESTSNVKNIKFLDRQSFQHSLSTCRVLFTHAGAGTLLQAVELGLKPVVFARRSFHNEHLNDHQMDICNEFTNLGLCYGVSHPEEVSEIIDDSTSRFRRSDGSFRQATTNNEFLESVKSSVLSRI